MTVMLAPGELIFIFQAVDAVPLAQRWIEEPPSCCGRFARSEMIYFAGRRYSVLLFRAESLYMAICTTRSGI